MRLGTRVRLKAELERVQRRSKFKTSIPAVQIAALLSALAEEGSDEGRCDLPQLIAPEGRE